MKTIINGLEVEGTPSEIQELYNLMKTVKSNKPSLDFTLPQPDQITKYKYYFDTLTHNDKLKLIDHMEHTLNYQIANGTFNKNRNLRNLTDWEKTSLLYRYRFDIGEFHKCSYIDNQDKFTHKIIPEEYDHILEFYDLQFSI